MLNGKEGNFVGYVYIEHLSLLFIMTTSSDFEVKQ